ncbi:MAG TPA: TROVE domain-containing protein [Pseudothermotoga sp.]
MSKFNNGTKGKNNVLNLAGGRAYSINDEKVKLVTMVLTTFFNEKKYYGDNSDEIVEQIHRVAEVDPYFVATLAVYARKVFHLRSVSHVLVAELANVAKGNPIVRKAVSEVVQRADDITEIMAYHLNKYGKPIPNSIKKGLADAFKRFDEYSLAKYNRRQQVTLKDVLCLVRPTPINQEQSDLWKRLIEDRLETPKTWETQLSTRGNNKEVWEELIAENRLGYMAGLRNLRNIIQSGAENIHILLNKLRDPEEVRKSKQLPFRFLAAYRELGHIAHSANPFVVQEAMDAVAEALEISAENLPHLKGKTFFVSDVSGSMRSPLSRRSKIQMVDVATLLMAMAHKFCEQSITSVFAENFAVVPVSKTDSVIANQKKFMSTNVGYATYLHKPLEWLLDNKVYVDRIVVFSDMQAYTEKVYYGWGYTRHGAPSPQQIIDQYRKEVNPDVVIHSVDLAGHGTVVFHPNDKKVNLIGGWSEKVLQLIQLAEKGYDTLVYTIENYKW